MIRQPTKSYEWNIRTRIVSIISPVRARSAQILQPASTSLYCIHFSSCTILRQLSVYADAPFSASLCTFAPDLSFSRLEDIMCVTVNYVVPDLLDVGVVSWGRWLLGRDGRGCKYVVSVFNAIMNSSVDRLKSAEYGSQRYSIFTACGILLLYRGLLYRVYEDP